MGGIAGGGITTLEQIESNTDNELAAATSVGSGNFSVNTAGTAQQLPTQGCRRVFIQAQAENKDAVVVGAASVVAAEATRQGIALFPTQGDWFNVNNLNLLYVDATVSGDGIHYYFEN